MKTAKLALDVKHLKQLSSEQPSTLRPCKVSS